MKCIECQGTMHKTTSVYRGMEFEAWQCSKCKVIIFTEEQADEVVKRVKAARLEQEYPKKPIRIGRSWGMTFPKEIVEVFQLDKKKIKLYPNVAENKIEIQVL